MGCKHARILLQFWVLGNHVEVWFHLAGWLKRHEYSAWFISGVRPYVRYHSRREEGVTRPKTGFFRSHFEKVFTFQHVEPFLLFVMQMTWWTTLSRIDRLQDEETPASILSGHFETESIGADIAHLAESIRTTGYHYRR